MPAHDPHSLLRAALPHLRAYRATLLESRSGAATDQEQLAFALSQLIAQIEDAVGRDGASGRPGSVSV